MKVLHILLLLLPCLAFSQISVRHTLNKNNSSYPIVGKNDVATIVYSSSENILVKKSVDFLAGDIESVSGKRPSVSTATKTQEKYPIIVATVGNNDLIAELVAKKKINVDVLKGQWERFIIQTVDDPFPGVKKALVIVGSDRRGAAYGVFTLSEKIGVSPWYWWADAVIEKNKEIYLEKCHYISKGPAVKYRGIFINDESPAFRNWATEKFGGINHQCYEKIFEVMLRNKANFLWPSMWLPTMFNVDDPLNPKVADEYGIVVSTSHHEPMMRAHNEWSVFNGGAWDYEKNKEQLRRFWRGGIERMGNYESVVTVGMRGDGDEGMSEETSVGLLKTIIKDQRQIISDVTGKPAEKTPQVWAIYKEVQDYYDKGLRVDDDITILFSDDNWGNLRYLPKKADLNHKGGYGMYYHFDYVGAPVSYRWLNVTQIERVWEQMRLSYEHGVKNLWIANVGDIKPMELPINFFLDYAWDPASIQATDLPQYYVNWAGQQFGNQYPREIAELLSLYTKYNARRVPEMLTSATYSVENYREADRIVEEYNGLAARSRKLYNQLSDEYKPAFFQLVLSPIELSANVNEMYVAAGKNKYYGERGAAAANYYADRVRHLFQKDEELTKAFHELKDGKWNHIMSQTHIGYTSWNHPPLNMMPAVSYVQVPKPAELGYLLEYGRRPQWGWLDVEADWAFSESLPAFDNLNQQNYYVDILNRGQEELSYSITPQQNWIKVSKPKGVTQYIERVYISIDWGKAPKEGATGKILISGAGKEYTVNVPVRESISSASGYIENNGVVAFEAASFIRKIDNKDVYWTVVPNLGRTSSSVIVEPVTAERQTLTSKSPRLEYEFTVVKPGDLTVHAFLSPTQDFKKSGGLKFAMSIDNEEPQLVNMNEGEIKPDYEYAEWWSKSVADHIKIRRTKHKVDKPGKHTLKIWMVDPGIVFQKFVIDAGGLKPSYLGPTESKYVGSK
ncbi:glycosyl hydrolase family 115 (putative glucuronidase) [Arcticibacter pallidicorallinus]|uniref:Glycosyl hydrolase family 115 (Putative glucuronidase) n=1 Tax=Arcticibacter pallidicorallinus TaxID=1259464 RepID=A0A2T0U4D0_9SPHI|nr:glycosyl hydrolase 115 family protein [Arcticibacter pallidicorallinus]PRY52776.1 glycosyl hydrolase family 115 (putative glucuronidase) [Arcticibacter pallidicorallinus]